MTQAAAYTVPGVEIRVITPSDSTDITGCRGIFTTDGGNIAVKTRYGASAETAVTVENWPIGFLVPNHYTRVMGTGTTATKIYGIF